jgi:hypothetical protein
MAAPLHAARTLLRARWRGMREDMLSCRLGST